MIIELVTCCSRSAVFELHDFGNYHTKEELSIYLNDSLYGTTKQTVFSVYGLQPGISYRLEVKVAGSEIEEKQTNLLFQTPEEFCECNVRDFGALGDGEKDDTLCIQAAIMACPEGGRVRIPQGTYSVSSIFLKSHLILELEKGAILKACTSRESFPKLPGSIPADNPQGELILGTWEGDPFPMYTGILCGIGVEHVSIFGEGIIDGQATMENWWKDHREMRGAYRPRLLFLERCQYINIWGVELRNSPSWTIHPFFSSHLVFANLRIQNPADSPNTDGLDPESCRDVRILGIHFDLGDDCIAIKSGKIYLGRTFHTPSEQIYIRHCLMEHGHGAVTVGSEVGAGVRDVLVEACDFFQTDRGLRIKSRRGRGKDSVIDRITFSGITMDQVMTPFVVNCFYFCDPDGKEPYVQSREALPVDDRTPFVKTLTFRQITCTNAHVAASFFYGLPERKIESLILQDVSIKFAPKAKEDIPAMLSGIEPCSKKGFMVSNVASLELHHVTISGQEGEPYLLDQVDQVIS